MEIRVSGHQIETGEAFRTYVDERLHAVADKYFDRVIGATVTLYKAPYDQFGCDVIMHVMQGLILKGGNRAPTANQALDGAAARIDKQLRRYMRRLKDRQTAQNASMKANLIEQLNNAAYTIFEPGQPEDEAPDAPLTIAETTVDIPDASVSDAVMMMDLRNTTALMFRNTGTGEYNMVYRREDGNIGWVEPKA